MTSKERVRSVFEGRIPDRVPLWHGLSAEFTAKALAETGLPDEEALRVHMGDDFRRIYASYHLPPREVRKVLEIMMPGGGYIAGASHDRVLKKLR